MRDTVRVYSEGNGPFFIPKLSTHIFLLIMAMVKKRWAGDIFIKEIRKIIIFNLKH